MTNSKTATIGEPTPIKIGAICIGSESGKFVELVECISCPWSLQSLTKTRFCAHPDAERNQYLIRDARP